jgi:hypothetical protein
MSIDFVAKFADASAHFAQVAAILIGGAWAYFKFIRGRVFKSRVDVQVDASLLQIGTENAVSATVRVQNIGLSRFRFARGESKIAVFWCPSGGWPAVSDLWTELATSPLFPDQEAIEGGETIVEQWVLPLPADPDKGFPLAYDVRAAVAHRTKRQGTVGTPTFVWWTGNTVVTVDLAPVGKSP